VKNVRILVLWCTCTNVSYNTRYWDICGTLLRHNRIVTFSVSPLKVIRGLANHTFGCNCLRRGDYATEMVSSTFICMSLSKSNQNMMDGFHHHHHHRRHRHFILTYDKKHKNCTHNQHVKRVNWIKRSQCDTNNNPEKENNTISFMVTQ